MPIALYHITHRTNLPSIIKNGGLWCDAERCKQGVAHQSIAHEHIKQRRARRLVKTPSGGTLADYVPFYFAPRSPMLFTIHRGNVNPLLRGCQNEIVHLVTFVETLAATSRPWCFTDRHADLDYARFFTDPALLASEISWEIMGRTYWSDSDEMRERR